MNVRLGLVGFGAVQRAFIDILRKKTEYLDAKDLHVAVTAVSDMHLGAAFDAEGLDLDVLAGVTRDKGALAQLPNGSAEPDNARCVEPDLVTFLSEAAYTNPVDGEPSLSLCRQALGNGVHVITTNKGPIAFGYRELKHVGAQTGAYLGVEGTVMSGTPVLSWAHSCFPGDRVTSAKGILNGTANFILGQIEKGGSFDGALKTAQDLGYAEADPTADIEGHDVRLKVAILATLLFDADIHPQDIPTTGISGLSESEVRSALATGAHWKLIGEVSNTEAGLVAQVGPRLMGAGDALAAISGPINALSLTSEHLGPVMQSGPGAGLIETGYALFADIIRIGEDLKSAGA